MDPDVKRRIGAAIKDRIKACGYRTREEVASAAQIGVRTVQSLVTGTWDYLPQVDTLNSLDWALSWAHGTLVAVIYGDGPLSLLAEPLAAPDDHVGWLRQSLAAAGATTDPDVLAEAGEEITGMAPRAAKALLVLAELLAADPVNITDGLDALTAGDRARLSALPSASRPARGRPPGSAGRRLTA